MEVLDMWCAILNKTTGQLRGEFIAEPGDPHKLELFDADVRVSFSTRDALRNAKEQSKYGPVFTVRLTNGTLDPNYWNTAAQAHDYCRAARRALRVESFPSLFALHYTIAEEKEALEKAGAEAYRQGYETIKTMAACSCCRCNRKIELGEHVLWKSEPEPNKNIHSFTMHLACFAAPPPKTPESPKDENAQNAPVEPAAPGPWYAVKRFDGTLMGEYQQKPTDFTSGTEIAEFESLEVLRTAAASAAALYPTPERWALRIVRWDKDDQGPLIGCFPTEDAANAAPRPRGSKQSRVVRFPNLFDLLDARWGSFGWWTFELSDGSFFGAFPTEIEAKNALMPADVDPATWAAGVPLDFHRGSLRQLHDRIIRRWFALKTPDGLLHGNYDSPQSAEHHKAHSLPSKYKDAPTEIVTFKSVKALQEAARASRKTATKTVEDFAKIVNLLLAQKQPSLYHNVVDERYPRGFLAMVATKPWLLTPVLLLPWNKVLDFFGGSGRSVVIPPDPNSAIQPLIGDLYALGIEARAQPDGLLVQRARSTSVTSDEFDKAFDKAFDMGPSDDW